MPELRVHGIAPRIEAARAQTRTTVTNREWTAGVLVFAVGLTLGALYAYITSAEWPEPDRDRAVSGAPPATPPVTVAVSMPLPIAAEPTTPTNDPSASRAAVTRPAPNTGFRGTLMVSSQPRGARVFLNDRYVGQTPMLIRALPAGSRAVRVRLDGYEPWSRGVSVVANQTTSIAARLNRVKTGGGTRR